MPFAQSVIVSLQFQFVFLDSQSCNEKELTYFFFGGNDCVAVRKVRKLTDANGLSPFGWLTRTLLSHGIYGALPNFFG